MLPTPQPPQVLPAPSGNPLTRAIAAVRRGQVPYSAQKWLDRACLAVGLRTKTMPCGSLRFQVRRMSSSDEMFVERVAGRSEYHPPGYEIRHGDAVVDVGGNIGTVVTIEPNSKNFALLQANIRLNRCGNVKAINAAVCKEPGTIQLHCGTEGGYNSIIAGRGGPQIETVQAIRLPEVMPDRCHFLKMDCEGAEHEILHNLPAECFARIDRIAMEWHGAKDRDERIAQGCALVDRLQEHGFQIDAFTEFVGFRGGMIFAKR
jgi:FkbM family methyltransferase